MTTQKFVYAFEEGDGKDKMLLGGKGANLCEMTQIGLNVPPGFTLTTDACRAYLEKDALPNGLMDEVLTYMKDLEKKTGKTFGGGDNPLLVSVRSGSSMSMPGMMDTILNLGINKTSLKALIKLTNNPRFGYDAYRRFIQLFGKIALGVEDKYFDEAMAAMKKKVGVSQDVDLNAEHLSELADQFAKIIEANTGKPFPDDHYKQREISIGAVFRSWNGKRAIDYRRQFKITKEQANGTAVNICTMVFGNMGNDSGTGVGFTRNPGTGENMIYGEYLVNAQGEDVVAGIRTPKAIAEMEHDMPEIYRQLLELHNRLESHYKEVQDFEFTIERGTLYCLQTRNGKMNAQAMVRTSVEMFNEDLISKEKALLRVDPAMLEQLLVPQLSPLLQAPLPARSFSMPILPNGEAMRVKKLFLCARKPSPKIFTASSRHKAFSPVVAAKPRTPLLSHVAWASPVFQDVKQFTSTISSVVRQSAIPSFMKATS